MLRQLLDLILIIIAVISALVGYLASGLNVFFKGFAVGAFVAALPLIIIRLFGVLRPELGIAAAERVAIEYVNKRHVIEKTISVDDVELKEKKWHVSGSWVPRGIVLTLGGSWKSGELGRRKDFEVVIDSRTGKVVKYSAKLRD